MPPSTHKHQQAPTNSLKYIRHLQHGSSGHLKDHTFTAKPTSAHKPCKPHQTPTTWVLGPYERPQPSTQSSQAPVNNLNHKSPLHFESLGHMRDHTFTMEPTNTHKPPKPHQTPTVWALGPYQGPHLHCRAHKHSQTSKNPADTHTLVLWAIRGTKPSLRSPQAPTNSLNHTRHLHCGSLGHTWTT